MTLKVVTALPEGDGPICGFGTKVLLDGEPFPIPLRGINLDVHIDRVVIATLEVLPSGVEIESPDGEIWLKHNGAVMKCYEIERGEPETGVVDMTHMQTTGSAREYARIPGDKE